MKKDGNIHFQKLVYLITHKVENNKCGNDIDLATLFLFILPFLKTKPTDGICMNCVQQWTELLLIYGLQFHKFV